MEDKVEKWDKPVTHLTICRGRIWGGSEVGELGYDVTEELMVGPISHTALEYLLRDVINKTPVGILPGALALYLLRHFGVVFKGDSEIV